MSYVQTEISKTIEVMRRVLADEVLLDVVETIGEVCARAILNGGKIMFCGNGGSAGDSQHLAAELVGKLVFARPALPGLALTVDTSALTALGNDFGYESVFSRQIEALGRAGDVLIGISTSGRSRNIISAMQAARARGIVTVAMTGETRGPMADLADHWLAIPHTETQKIQEGHIVLGHIFCALVEEEIFGARKLT